MSSIRRWLPILFALLLGGRQAYALTTEDRAYSAAVAAFHDQFYSAATNQFTAFLQNYHRSTNAPMAILLLGQAQFHQKNYPATVSLLGDAALLSRAKMAGLADQYDYWKAEAEFAQGDYPGAAQTFVSLTEDYPRSPLALRATIEAAAAYGDSANWPRVDALLDNPDGIFQQTAQLDPDYEQVANGRLLQAESKCNQNEFAAALPILSLLNQATLTPEQNWQRAYLTYRANVGINNLTAALAATADLLQISRNGQSDAWSTNLAESVLSRAQVLEQQNRLPEATAALQENLSNGVPSALQQQTILALSDLAVAQKNLSGAESSLENYLAQYPDSPAAEIALLTLAELHFISEPSATNELAAAREKVDAFLTASASSPLAGKAYLARGWYFWLQQKFPESLADFEAAARLLPRGRDWAVAKFKMGDVQFASMNYAGAETNYEAVVANEAALTETGPSLAARALYQILRIRLELHELDGIDDSMRQLQAQFFTNSLTESGLLLAGEKLTDFDLPAQARDVFLNFERERPDSPLLPEVAFAVARTYEREQNWPEAATHDEAWLKTYPTSDLRVQVEYARDWAITQTNEAAGFGLFTNFVNQYTNATLTPLAEWWVADHYFRSGTNSVDAEKYYELIFQVFPANGLAPRAQLMAARAAMARGNYSEANSYLPPLINDTNAPDELRDDARFAYVESLHSLAPSDTNNASLLTATNVLVQMIPEAETNITGALAWCETGDCDMLMGVLDAATNAYAQVLVSPPATEELRSRAKVGLGTVLEKKAEGVTPDMQPPLKLQALNAYLDVLYSTNSVADPFWTKEAGLKALPLMVVLKEGDVDKFIDSLERWLPQLKDSLEKKRAALKQ